LVEEADFGVEVVLDEILTLEVFEVDAWVARRAD
jgi:hypothetical protein